VTRVLIADDDALMRAGLVELLTADPELEIIGQAATGRQAIEQTRRLAPDVVLMDVRMPDLDGIAATRALARATPGVRVLILTTFEQDDYIFGALRAGASGFLLKRARPEELLGAVHTIAAGEALLSPSVTRRVIDRMAQQPTPELADQAKLDALTPREREVLERIARGLSNREIAAALSVEESTVRTHVKRILMKLELRDRVQAVIFAYESGVNRPPVGAKPTRSQARSHAGPKPPDRGHPAAATSDLDHVPGTVLRRPSALVRRPSTDLGPCTANLGDGGPGL
jgi:DNA-binding NarL/FixJ family response regulator